MKASKIRDQKLRFLVTSQEEKKRCLQVLKKSKLSMDFPWWARHHLSLIGGKKPKNFCLLTSRGRSVGKQYKLSRLAFSRWVNQSSLPGIGRSSW
jgi:ribosomal protein S14